MIGLADLVLINLKGENVMEMTDVLQIVVHAFLRMKLADFPHIRQCMFIHQNVPAVNAQEKLALARQKLQEQLDRMTKQASIAQGLSETITLFDRIISFDCQRDVVYFSNLWHGSPPMAAINQGYSIQAAETRQRILHKISQKFSRCIMIADFIQRLKYMWNGVLADDFIFNFRSSWAAKAYIEVEREIARLTFVVEQDLLNWANNHCKVQINNCQSEVELQTCFQELKLLLQSQIAEKEEQNMKVLEEIFEKHAAYDVIIKYKPEKMSSLQTFGQVLVTHTESDLEDMNIRKLFDLRQQSASQAHEQEIIRRAVTVAEKKRGKYPGDWELQEMFDKVWNNWATSFISAPSHDPLYVQSTFYQILLDKMKSEGNNMYFFQQQKVTPLRADGDVNDITTHEITKDHIMLQDAHLWQRFRRFVDCVQGVSSVYAPSTASYINDAVDAANRMLNIVMDEVEKICKQDTMFKPLHGRKIIDDLWTQITKHNNLPLTETKFSFTSQFNAMIALRVACYAVFKFEQMNQRFEEKHGIQAQMNMYKRRVFLLFKNTVQEASAEVTASEDFCETIKGKLIEYVKAEVEQSVLKEMYQAVGSTKYDFIIKMLDEIVQTEKFSALCDYVETPFKYAESWIQKFGLMHIFTTNNTVSKYCEYADQAAEKIISNVRSSVSAATKEMSTMEDSGNYSVWITEFCTQMNGIILLDPEKLKMASVCNIKNFGHYQKFLESGLQNLEKDIKAEFHRTTAETVTWLHGTDPFSKVCGRLWGCTEHCPFCGEPCQDSDPYHKSSHRCVQHRPTCVQGTRHLRTKFLRIETCSLEVASERTFRCDVINFQCQNIEFCKFNKSDGKEDLERHPYREYKKFAPKWDIAPDPACEASKYWQWIVVRFEKDMLKNNPGTQINIPDSWKLVTKQEATDSLRIFH